MLAGCSSSDSEEEGPPGERGARGDAPTPAVEVVKARYGSLPLQKRMTGTVRAENQVAIYPEINAPVTRVAVENGDYVRQGEAMVYLRDQQYRDQVRQAEAALEIARANANQAEATLRELESRLQRTRQLAEKQYQSDQELETLQAQVDGAKASLQQAEKQYQSDQELETLQAQVDGAKASLQQAEGQVAQAEATLDERREALRRTVIRAPVSGYVGQRDAEIGMRVDGSTRLFTLGNLDRVRVEVAVPDEMLGRIQTGQTALITAPSLEDSTIRASVSRISPFVEPGSFSAEAEIDVPNDGQRLRAGMFVTVDVLYGESQQATLVPLSAIYEDPASGNRGIFVAPTLGAEIPLEEPTSYDPDNPPPLTEPTPTAFREVEILAEGQQTAGVRGIQPGTWVVTVGQNLLSTRTGERVQARVRPVAWSRLMALQRLQDTDLLYRVLERQQRIAKQRFGARDTTQSDTAETSAATATEGRTPDTTGSTAALTVQP
ncbi:MAG: efflux RND transporter periplasmic adaptor subunit [Bacteroidetes bacterium]|nr:efflux RND transporter periplasmic adaptor subunit [Bacteroidota bacterium]